MKEVLPGEGATGVLKEGGSQENESVENTPGSGSLSQSPIGQHRANTPDEENQEGNDAGDKFAKVDDDEEDSSYEEFPDYRSGKKPKTDEEWAKTIKDIEE